MASGQDSSNTISVMEDFISEKAGKSGVTFKDEKAALEIEISKLLDRVEGTSNKWACLSCGKIDQKINIKNHIEGHHIERRDVDRLSGPEMLYKNTRPLTIEFWTNICKRVYFGIFS